MDLQIRKNLLFRVNFLVIIDAFAKRWLCIVENRLPYWGREHRGID